jgi:Bacterial Ig-like domain/Beta-propeller repeat
MINYKLKSVTGREQSSVSKGGHMKRITRLAFYSLVALMTACGGGGGGGGAAAPVGPVVVSTSPANNAVNVPTATKVSATFSVPIAPIAFTFPNYTSAFTLKNPAGTIVQGTIAPSPDAKTWTFTPDASLDVNTKYTATFKKGPAGVNDLALPPNPMAADYVWSFTTSSWNGTQMRGTIVDEKAYGVATDSTGNIYVTGYTNGSLDGVPNADISGTAGTTGDVFLVKYNSAGQWQWTRLLGTQYNDVAHGIAIDASDNIYVAGYTFGTLDNTNPNPSVGTISNAFVARYNTAGNLILVRQSGTAFNNKAYGVTVDTTGNIYVAGETGDTVADPTSGDIFLAQYSAAGVQNWIKTLASTVAAADTAYGVAVSGGNIYVAGYTSGVLAGAPGGTVNQGGKDIFVAQFDASAGNLSPVWVQQFGTGADDIAFSVTADASGNVFAAGTTFGGLDGNALVGGSDAFVVKYSSAGARQWTRQLGTTDDDDAFGVATDASGNVYLTGDTFGSLPGNTSSGLADLFAAKYNTGGTLQWVKQQGSLQSDVGQSVITYSNSSLFVAGYTFGTLPGVNTLYNNQDPTGNTADLFLAKYDLNGVLF